jgi:hypothetical protein
VPAFPAQHHVNALIAEAWWCLGNLGDTHAQRRLITGPAAVVPSSPAASAQADRPAPY